MRSARLIVRISQACWELSTFDILAYFSIYLFRKSGRWLTLGGEGGIFVSFYWHTPSPQDATRWNSTVRSAASLPEKKPLFYQNFRGPRPTQWRSRNCAVLQREHTGGPHGCMTTWNHYSAQRFETKLLYAFKTKYHWLNKITFSPQPWSSSHTASKHESG